MIFFAGELNKEISLQKSSRFFAGVLVEGGLKFSFVGLVMIMICIITIIRDRQVETYDCEEIYYVGGGNGGIESSDSVNLMLLFDIDRADIRVQSVSVPSGNELLIHMQCSNIKITKTKQKTK